MDDRMCRFLAGQLCGEWEQLATYLGLSAAEIWQIKQSTDQIENKIFQMLVKWKQGQPSNVNKVHVLCGGLGEVGRVDLAEKLSDGIYTLASPEVGSPGAGHSSFPSPVSHPHGPVKKQCLFLKGIPDGCSSETLAVFIGSRTDMDEDLTIQYGWVPGTALCTFEKDIPDLEKAIEKISSKKLLGVKVTAEKVHESRCILVCGLSSGTSAESIQCYFDKEEESGGSGVQNVRRGSENGEAIVYFQHWKVVSDVLSKSGSHKIDGAELSVEEYRDSLGRLSLDAPTRRAPKPVSVQVNGHVMEFIFDNGKHLKMLIEQLNEVGARLEWPDENKNNAARLEPFLCSRARQSSLLKWSKTAADVLTSFQEKFKSFRIPIQQSLWKDATTKIQQLDTKGYSIERDAHRHIVHLVGEKVDVDNAKADIETMLKELGTPTEHQAQQTKQLVSLSPVKLQLFHSCRVKDDIERRFPTLKVSVTLSHVILEGTMGNIQEARLSLQRQMDAVESVQVKISTTKARFVQSASDKINMIVRSQNIRAVCIGSDEGDITVCGATQEDALRAKEYIEQQITEDVIPVPTPKELTVLLSEDGTKLFKNINQENFVMADICNLNNAGNCVALAGFKVNLENTKQRIIAFMEGNFRAKKFLLTSENKVQFLNTFYGQDLVNLQTQNVTVQSHVTGRYKGFKIVGNEVGLKAATQVITSLAERIVEKPYPVSKTGMAQLFREGKGKKFLASMEREFQCTIRENVKEEGYEGGAGERPIATTKEICRIALPNGCTLRVCRGDLAMQEVDCIVNAANADLANGEGLGASYILKAGGPVIRTEYEQILKTKGRQLYVGEPVCTSSGNLPCKKVIHVAVPCCPSGNSSARPDQGPIYEVQLLFFTVIKCLQLASNQHAQSVAIPALSTGPWGFPVEFAARQIFIAVAQFCQDTPNSSLTDISLTNHDQATCDAFRQVVSRFQEESVPAYEVVGESPVSASLNEVAGVVAEDEGTKDTMVLSICAMELSTIRKVTDKIDQFQEEEYTAEVQWRCNTPRGMVTYEPKINAAIEDAYQRNLPSVDVHLEEGEVTINLQQMQHISRTRYHSVWRVDLQKARTFELPSNWIPMSHTESFKMVTLTAASQEYTTIARRFQSSVNDAPRKILEIQRVQNKDLLMVYQVRQAAMEARLGRTNIEETLYHSTDEKTCKTINKQGFKRSFGNTNALGNGICFTVRADCSEQFQYAKPSAGATKQIYLAKVLVGDYTTGSHGIVRPPNKPGSPGEQYDSVVDNTTHPSTYVIFREGHAYPEYLIKYK